MFIKFGDKTEKIVVKNSTNEDDNEENDNDNEDKTEDALYDRRAQMLKKYKNKKLHKNI